MLNRAEILRKAAEAGWESNDAYTARKSQEARMIQHIRPTRYPELGYRQDGPSLWRIVAIEGDASVGPYYQTRAELLADLNRYAKEYGCDA